MNRILVLLLETVLLFAHFNVCHSEYVVRKEALDGPRKISSRIVYMPSRWMPGSYIRIMRPQNNQVASVNNIKTPEDESDINLEDNNFLTKNHERQLRIMNLAVRQTLATMVKKILEELAEGQPAHTLIQSVKSYLDGEWKRSSGNIQNVGD